MFRVRNVILLAGFLMILMIYYMRTIHRASRELPA